MKIDAYLIKSFQFPFGFFDQLRGNDSGLKGQKDKLIHQKAPNIWGPKNNMSFFGDIYAPVIYSGRTYTGIPYTIYILV